jgi:hypothetical protein
LIQDSDGQGERNIRNRILERPTAQIDAGKYPTLAAWIARVTSRPSLKALIEQDQGFLARLEDSGDKGRKAT